MTSREVVVLFVAAEKRLDEKLIHVEVVEAKLCPLVGAVQDEFSVTKIVPGNQTGKHDRQPGTGGPTARTNAVSLLVFDA